MQPKHIQFFLKNTPVIALNSILDCSANQERILKFYSYSGIDGIGSIECNLNIYSSF